MLFKELKGYLSPEEYDPFSIFSLLGQNLEFCSVPLRYSSISLFFIDSTPKYHCMGDSLNTLDR